MCPSCFNANKRALSEGCEKEDEDNDDDEINSNKKKGLPLFLPRSVLCWPC